MAVIATTSGYKVTLLLDAGTSESGKVITTSVSLGKLDSANQDHEKVMAIANLLEPVLDNEIYTVREVTTKTLSE